MTAPESATLQQALDRYGVEVPAEQVQTLEAYCRALWDWNTKFNLTRHTNFDIFVARDLIDSLQLAKLLKPGEEVLDVGSGGGVPGIVLAILRPDVQISLSESVGKKVDALNGMVEHLDLSVGVHACRAEEVLKDMRFNSLVARAVGPLERMLRWFQPHWLSMDRLLIIKGPRWTEERAEAEASGVLRQLDLQCVAQYPMPGTESHSYILEITPSRKNRK
jgi:16S rRNA (guanine527-N7)-methyltransferase